MFALVVNGDQRLATAGTGDVLAGIIGAVGRERRRRPHGGAAGAWMHAAAAVVGPPRGFVASDLLEHLPDALAALG